VHGELGGKGRAKGEGESVNRTYLRLGAGGKPLATVRRLRRRSRFASLLKRRFILNWSLPRWFFAAGYVRYPPLVPKWGFLISGGQNSESFASGRGLVSVHRPPSVLGCEDSGNLHRRTGAGRPLRSLSIDGQKNVMCVSTTRPAFPGNLSYDDLKKSRVIG